MYIIISMSSAIRSVYLAMLVCCYMMPSLSYSAAWQFEPAIALRGLYDDNIRLEIDDEDKVTTATLSPTLTLARYTDLTTLNGFFRYDLNESWGDTDNWNDKNNWLAGTSITTRGERSRLGLRTTFKQDTLLRSLRAPVDPDEPPVQVPDESVDDGSVRSNIRRNRIDVRPSFTYDLTERWQLGLGYRYQYTFYGENDTNDDGRDDLFDFDKHTIKGLVSVPITEKNFIVSTLLFSRFDSDSSRTTDNFELQAGLRHEFDETTDIVLTLGGRHTELDDRNRDDTSTGWVARLAGSKTTGLTTFSGSVERKLSPSGSGDEVETDEGNFNITRQLTEFISLSLRTRIFENESIRSARSNNNRRFLLLEPSFLWTLTEAWSISAGYRYRRQKDFGEPRSADSNAAFLTLLYQPLTELGKRRGRK